MRLLIKQRVFSWTDTYDIYDEWNNPKYFVKAEFFSLTHQLHVYDNNDREIGIIHQKMFTLLPTFEIEVDGEIRGVIKKKFSFFHPQYEIDYRGWHVEGDFLGWDYDVYDACSSVCFWCLPSMRQTAARTSDDRGFSVNNIFPKGRKVYAKYQEITGEQGYNRLTIS